MEYICPECEKEFQSPAALGAHRWKSHGIAGKFAKANPMNGVMEKLEEISNKLNNPEKVYALENSSEPEHNPGIACPVCGSELELVSATPINVGLYQLKCQKCFNEGG